MADYLCVLYGDYTKDEGENGKAYPNLLLWVKVRGDYDRYFGALSGLIEHRFDRSALVTRDAAKNAYSELKEAYEGAIAKYVEQNSMMTRIKSNLTLGELLQDGAGTLLAEIQEQVDDAKMTMTRLGMLLGQIEVIQGLVDDGFPLTVVYG